MAGGQECKAVWNLRGVSVRLIGYSVCSLDNQPFQLSALYRRVDRMELDGGVIVLG